MKILRYIKRWILWDFGRNSIPYEVVCAIYIGLLVFLPVNSNGWINNNATLELPDQPPVTFHREGVVLYFSWEDEAPEVAALEQFARERFGRETVLVKETDLGPNAMRIIPGGWEWKNVLP